uniref:MED4 polymerase n=1 Tax=Heligmosomoides polygyrus TaxID=6339 RepID=A0A183GA08_HELPZ
LIHDPQMPAHLKTILGHLLEKMNRTEELLTKNQESEKRLQHEIGEKTRLQREVDALKEALSRGQPI